MIFINQNFLEIHNQLENIRNHPEHLRSTVLYVDLNDRKSKSAALEILSGSVDKITQNEKSQLSM